MLSSHDPSLQVDNGWGLGEVKVILARGMRLSVIHGSFCTICSFYYCHKDSL